MGKVVRLTESDLVRIVNRIISEQTVKPADGVPSSPQSVYPPKSNTQNAAAPFNAYQWALKMFEVIEYLKNEVKIRPGVTPNLNSLIAVNNAMVNAFNNKILAKDSAGESAYAIKVINDDYHSLPKNNDTYMDVTSHLNSFKTDDMKINAYLTNLKRIFTSQLIA
jgi:hypothetical protein